MKHTSRAPICLAAILLASAACDSGSGQGMNFKNNKAGTGTPVASWKGDSITTEQLSQRFEEMSPFARANYQTLAQKKEYVEGIARFELLAAEAHRRGLQQDPDVVETAKKMMVQKLIQKEFDEKAGTPIPDSELQSYYDKHKTDYVKPEMIRMTQIFFAAPKDAPDRAAKQAKAEEIQKLAAAAPPMDFQTFTKWVRELSEEPRTKPLDGDMRYLAKEELATQYGPEVATAAEGLKEVGAVSPVIATEKGFHLLKLQGRQQALNLTMDQVKTQLQARILYERRTTGFNAFIAQLQKGSDFKVLEEPLSKMTVDLKAPSKPSKGPPPGFIPAQSPSGQ